jgi:hypothetical protein
LWTVEFEGEPSAVERLQEEALEQRVNEPSIWRRLDFDRLSGHEIAFDESRSRWTLRWGCTLSGLIHQDAATGQVTVSAKSSWSVPLLGLLLALQSLLQGEWPWVIVGCVAVGVLLTMRSARFDELTRALREMACRKA